MLFLIFGHVKTKYRCVILEKELSKRLSKLGLTGTCRTQEEEASDWLSFLIKA